MQAFSLVKNRNLQSSAPCSVHGMSLLKPSAMLQLWLPV